MLNKKAARVEVNISLAFLHWVRITFHPWPFVSDIAVFVLKRDVRLQLTHSLHIVMLKLFKPVKILWSCGIIGCELPQCVFLKRSLFSWSFAFCFIFTDEWLRLYISLPMSALFFGIPMACEHLLFHFFLVFLFTLQQGLYMSSPHANMVLI